MPQLHQSMYLLLFSIAFYLKHELTKAALRNHLKIRNIATNNSYKKLASPYTLLTNYKLLKSEFKIECVCREKTCKDLLECGEDGFPKVAQNCGHKNIQSSSNSRQSSNKSDTSFNTMAFQKSCGRWIPPLEAI